MLKRVWCFVSHGMVKGLRDFSLQVFLYSVHLLVCSLLIEVDCEKGPFSLIASCMVVVLGLEFWVYRNSIMALS